MKILVIEDEREMREILCRYLTQERYVVSCAATCTEARQRLNDYTYDCVLLDIMLPDGDGLSLLRELKEDRRRESVIVLSARNSIDDKVVGLETGADDYLPKPFHLTELNARIKSVMRRSQRDGDLTIVVGNLSLNPDIRQVTVGGKPLDLNRKEYDLLYYFISNPGRLIARTALAESVWGDHIDQADDFDFIYSQVKNLRRKLKEAGADPQIRTVYGIGYKLEES